ncbi:MAG: hypothetical protein WCF67_08765 [Chitinophagaceae bacterium]
MAKIKPSIIEYSGKVGDVVHIHGRRYEAHTRKPVKKGVKKNEPVLKHNYARTKYLNTLASEINTIITDSCGTFKPSSFYQVLQARFRKEPLNNRLLLLMQLKRMEINVDYPMSKLGRQVADVRIVKNKIVVDVQVKSYPSPGKHKADCYYYEVLLITWNKNNKVAYDRQLSDWIYIDKGKPEFVFEFPKTATTTQWLLCLRQRLGVGERSLDVLVADGMQVVEVGSLDKKDVEMLKKREGESGKVVERKVVKKEEVVRVKAKRVV